MDDDRELLGLAAAWRPQRPGRRGPRDVADALVEPDWGGVRAVAALTPDRAVVVAGGRAGRDPGRAGGCPGRRLRRGRGPGRGQPDDFALRSGDGALPELPTIERPPILIPRAIRRDVKDDPFVRARDFETRTRGVEPAVLEALERGERHAFVATDLLWLDGTPLDDVPLLERKRLLEGVLEPSFLVRVTPYVKPSAILTLVTWGNLGFAELHHRAANGRYLAGEENPDWAVAAPPRGPTGPVRPTAPPR